MFVLMTEGMIRFLEGVELRHRCQCHRQSLTLAYRSNLAVRPDVWFSGGRAGVFRLFIFLFDPQETAPGIDKRDRQARRAWNAVSDKVSNEQKLAFSSTKNNDFGLNLMLCYKKDGVAGGSRRLFEGVGERFRNSVFQTVTSRKGYTNRFC